MNTHLEQIASMTQDVTEIKAAVNFLMKSALNQVKEEWIDAQDVMMTLHISVRTLQTWRDKGILPFSKINGKFYYKVSDIRKMLEANYSKSNRY